MALSKSYGSSKAGSKLRSRSFASKSALCTALAIKPNKPYIHKRDSQRQLARLHKHTIASDQLRLSSLCSYPGGSCSSPPALRGKKPPPIELSYQTKNMPALHSVPQDLFLLQHRYRLLHTPSHVSRGHGSQKDSELITERHSQRSSQHRASQSEAIDTRKLNMDCMLQPIAGTHWCLCC